MNDDLTPEEIAALRAILRQDERLAWLYASVRLWAAWVLGVLAALVAFRQDISALLAWLFRGPQ